ncbi:MAG TPA: HDOD domain-containing protein [Ectothiorhodospiraceae bacterium]|nr:HDOD domain-containing protein [Ectothiorhodospiraceae bacterium]
MSAKSKKELTLWVNRIKNEDMPSFGKSIQDIVKVTEGEVSSASDLAQVILHDVSMTSKVIKVANSIYFNPQNVHVSTVSRAVISVGFNTIRDISLAVALVETLVKGRNKKQLITELARCIHAATQAKSLAELSGDTSPEEVFIETLLNKIGELVFWSFSGAVGEQLLELMNAPGYTPESAQEELLGFRLDQLGRKLRSEWMITNPDKKVDTRMRAKAIELAYKVSDIAEKKGWRSSKMKDLIAEIGQSMSLSTDQVMEMLHTNAKIAAGLARNLGAGKSARIIPIPKDNMDWDDDEFEEDFEEELEEISLFPEPDGALQLKILRELSQQIEEKPDFNVIMELVLEGIYRGVGTDRALFALLTPDRKGIRAKTTLGYGNVDLGDKFQFYNDGKTKNIFFLILEREACYIVDAEKKPELAPFLPSDVTSVIGKAPFLAAPIVINGRAIGLFYADRAVSGRGIDNDTFENFSYIVKQANMGLTLAVTRKAH